MTKENVDFNRRFGGIARLYGEKKLQIFNNTHICIIGLGGVGSWAAESFVRHGIGKVTLIDMDHIAESNINRQIQALHSTIGDSKIRIMAKRLKDINPEIFIKTIDDFLEPNNIEQYINSSFDFVIDAIDQTKVKIALAEFSPTAKLSAESTKSNDVSSTVDEKDQETLKAEVSWPLFKGGSNYFGLKKVKEIKNQKQLLFEDSKKSNETAVANAWSSLQSSKSVLNSIKSQVRAAEIANEGITSEYESGNSRTTLEVSQSRQALLDARINLATSNRNFLISQFNLLSAIGQLTAKDLGLKQ